MTGVLEVDIPTPREERDVSIRTEPLTERFSSMGHGPRRIDKGRRCGSGLRTMWVGIPPCDDIATELAEQKEEVQTYGVVSGVDW